MPIGFQLFPDGMRATMPAGATWDWTIDASADLSATNDTIQSAIWTLETGLIAGAATTTATKSTIFITAPAVSRVAPYLCTLTYQTVGGRITPKAFWLFVVDPILLF